MTTLASTDPGRIAILTVTRGRPEPLRRMLAAMDATVADPTRIEHWLLIDEDDASMRPLVEAGEFRALTRYAQHWLVRPRPHKLADAWNAAWEAARGRAGIYIGFTDDYEMRTPGWDDQVRQALGAFADGIALAFLPDPSNAGRTVTIICGLAPLFEQLGYFVVPYFPFWFMDAWIDDIASTLMRRVTVAVDMGAQSADPRGKASGLRNLPFWFDVYCDLAFERQEIVERLRRLIYPPDSPDFARSVALGEERKAQAARDRLRYTPETLSGWEAQLAAEKGPPSAAYLALEEEARRHRDRVLVRQMLRERQDALRAALDNG